MDRDASLEQLITTFNELNSPKIHELESEPSPLEFMRYVARNTPFVVRGGAASWKAVQRWTPEYLKNAMGGQQVNIAVTPHGNADSPTFCPELGEKVLAKPHEEYQDFGSFVDYLIAQGQRPDDPALAQVRYAQTQNDNFCDEYSTLLSDAQRDIPFARIALGKEPDAVNMWVGNSRSVTATHKDNFENIFVQVRGTKEFVLLPPVCMPCMNERSIPQATYVRDGETLSLKPDEPAASVPFVTWDPETKDGETPYSHLACPMRVSVHAGDMLYLPAMWYHKVLLSPSEGCSDKLVISLNYWYDMDFSGSFYPLTTYLRQRCEQGCQHG